MFRSFLQYQDIFDVPISKLADPSNEMRKGDTTGFYTYFTTILFYKQSSCLALRFKSESKFKQLVSNYPGSHLLKSKKLRLTFLSFSSQLHWFDSKITTNQMNIQMSSDPNANTNTCNVVSVMIDVPRTYNAAAIFLFKVKN